MNPADTWMSGSRTADRLDEIASALDAGLRAESALRAAKVPVDPGSGIANALRKAKLGLSTAELDLLEACERAGRLAPALRARATAVRAQRSRRRQLLLATAYPAFLLLFALLLCFTIVTSGRTLATAVSIGLLALAILGVWLRLRFGRAHRDPGIDPGNWPILGRIFADAAEIPYLEALGALHGAGVKIDEAHRIATRTVELAAPRARLVVAQQAVDAGRSLTESLAAAHAVSLETIELLGNGEPIGALEDALERAAARRRQTYEMRATRLVRMVGAASYVLAAGLVLAVAFSFYGGRLQGLGR